MAKYGRYLDSEDRKKNASSEGNSDLILVGLILTFPFVIAIFTSFGQPQSATTVSGRTRSADNDSVWQATLYNITTCAEAERRSKITIADLDAVRTATGSERASYEKYRDRVDQALEKKEFLCN